MNMPFILVEDTDVDPELEAAVREANPTWNLQLYKITNVDTYDFAISSLSNPSCGDLVAAFDLDYFDKVGLAGKTLHWDQMEGSSKDIIPQRTKHGVNALLCLLSNLKEGNCLVVVASNFTGDNTDPGRALTKEIQKMAKAKRPAVVAYAHFPGGPLTVSNAILADRLRGINNAWNAFFGSMASKLRASRNAGWFKEGEESPAHMTHDLSSDVDSIKEELKHWLACVSGADLTVVKASLDTVFTNHGYGFYKRGVQRVTGACALHCGRKHGKPLNMHGLALIACCYARDFAAVFNGVSWLANASAPLIESKEDTTESEILLYALVGEPTDHAAAPPSGVFGILGVHDGRDGGTKGTKTVTCIKLARTSVQVTFAVRGTELASNYETGKATGSAFCALRKLSDIVSPFGVKIACTGTDSEFTLIISKP